MIENVKNPANLAASEASNQSPSLPKRVHVVGICGVATSAIAIAFQKRGVIVTGSDKGFFPPISLELEKHRIPFYAGWHPEKMIEGGVPDLIMVGTASGSQNSETLYAKEHDIRVASYPEIIGQYFTREHSIVCSGTWGKTSSAALLSFILEYANYDPTYMFGGVSLSHDSSAKLTDSKWNIFEGDEYKSSPTDLRAKFFHYKPTHLLLSAVSWDHADLYPTEAEYFQAFKKLVSTIPANGLVVACADNEGVDQILNQTDLKSADDPTYVGKIIFYGRKGNKKAKYTYSNVHQSTDGLKLTISNAGADHPISSPLLGLYQSENITGCFAMATEIGIESTVIVEAIAKFKGLKRRMEKRSEGDVTVIDDIAHSPEKASSVLQTLKSIYQGSVIAVFEPNSGGRQRESAQKYDKAFESADVMIIPRLTKLKSTTAESAKQPLEGGKLAQIIGQTHSNVLYLEEDAKLIEYLISNAKKGDVIAFLGSHGFRGMIEELISNL